MKEKASGSGLRQSMETSSPKIYFGLCGELWRIIPKGGAEYVRVCNSAVGRRTERLASSCQSNDESRTELYSLPFRMLRPC